MWQLKINYHSVEHSIEVNSATPGRALAVGKPNRSWRFALVYDADAGNCSGDTRLELHMCSKNTVEVNASFALAVVNQNTATAFVDGIATSTVLNQVVMCVAQASDNQS